MPKSMGCGNKLGITGFSESGLISKTSIVDEAFHGHDVLPLAEDVGHGVPHHVDEDLLVFLVEFNVRDKKRREPVEGNSK